MTQMTGTFAGGHGGTKQFRERLGKLRQRSGQGMAFHDPAPDRRQQTGNPALGSLFRHCLERFLQRQTGLNQRGQLQGQQRQVGGT